VTDFEPRGLERRQPTEHDMVVMWLSGYRAAVRDAVEASASPPPGAWRSHARRIEQARRSLRWLRGHEVP
jgi:hypothetical protein